MCSISRILLAWPLSSALELLLLLLQEEEEEAAAAEESTDFSIPFQYLLSSCRYSERGFFVCVCVFVCVCMCLCAYVRAYVRACACVCVRVESGQSSVFVCCCEAKA